MPCFSSCLTKISEANDKISVNRGLKPSAHSCKFRKKAIEIIVGKGESADNQHFLFFPQSSLPF